MCEKVLKKYVYQTQEFLHTIPEPAFEEYKTSRFVAQQLTDMGYEVEEQVAKTGVIGYMEGRKKHPCIAIRADLDCIIHEDGDEIIYRHSCGHDAHSSIALGIAKHMKDRMKELNGSIKFIFQPAEETGLGAKAMVEADALHDVDYLIGYHLRTDHECPFGKMAPALYHSAACTISGEIEGKASHGGRPHLGINVIDILTSLLTTINTVRYNPQNATNVKFTKLIAGKGSLNVIPGYGSFGMDIRSDNNDELEITIEKIKKMMDQIAAMYDAKITYQVSEGVPAPKYDLSLMNQAERSIKSILGDTNYVEPIFTPGGEDFHYYTKLTEVKAAYLAIGADVSPGLHDPNMTFEKKAMINGVRVVVDMIEEMLMLNETS